MTRMSKEEFRYLYLNTNSLLDIIMRETYAYLVRDAGAMPELGEDDVVRAKEELSSIQLDDLNLDALSGLGDVGSIDLKESELDGLNLQATSDSWVSEMPSAGHDSLSHGMVINRDTDDAKDYDHYIQQIYRECSVQSQAEKIYPKVDVRYLDGLLAKLPDTITVLTSRLSGDDVKQWLDVSKQENQPLMELFQYIRCLTVGGLSSKG